MNLTVGENTLTFSVPQPNFYPPATARLEVDTARGRPVFGRSVTSYTPDSVTFVFTLEPSDVQFMANCDDCAWGTGSYTVWISEGDFALDPPTKILSQGSVSISGELPCSDCGGTDPPSPPDPPPDQDDPFGDPTPDDPLVLPPDDPGDQCLPTGFVMPTPPVPTPCGTGGPGGGGVVFS